MQINASLVKGLCWLMGIAGILSVLFTQFLIITVNMTQSLDKHVYVVALGMSVKAGDYVQFYAPGNGFYVDEVPFTKRVVGVADDIVSITQATWTVNGYSAVLRAVDSDGQPMHPGPTGIVPTNKIVVMGDHPGSLDSRYANIGWIDPANIRGRAFPIF